MTIIGITGGSGAGKTTVLDVLREFDAHVIDCDALYHRLLEESAPLLGELWTRFGKAVFTPAGRLDRKALGNVVFRDAEALAELSEITHKYIRAEVERQIGEARSSGRRGAAVDAIALLESGLGELCDVTVAVTAPAPARVARLMAREGVSREYAEARIAAQKPDSFFEERCDIVLRNDGDKETCRAQARALFEKIWRSFR